MDRGCILWLQCHQLVAWLDKKDKMAKALWFVMGRTGDVVTFVNRLMYRLCVLESAISDVPHRATTNVSCGVGVCLQYIFDWFRGILVGGQKCDWIGFSVSLETLVFSKVGRFALH